MDSSPTDLHGVSVLLVEDDFLVARETREALQQAGATVLGPFGDAQSALRNIAIFSPSCAVVDVNLAEGPCFSVATALRDKGVPLLFITGSSVATIPRELSDAMYLQKPVSPEIIVRSTSLLISQ